jgi:hypothetical protein
LKRNKVAAPGAGDLARELALMFQQLRQRERAADADQSEESRTKLGNFKRAGAERIDSLMPRIWQVLSDATIQHPDILEQFMALSMPSPRQTSHTWGPFLGRLRQLLESAAPGSSIKLNGSTERSATAGMSDADPERASFGSSRLRKPAVQRAKETSTCKELAERWSLGESTIRRIFRDEPGVLRIPHSRRRGKRDYISIRIPASVEARVRSRMSRPLFRVEVE